MFHECRHIKTNGRRCHAAALRGKDWCYFHQKLHCLVNPRTGEHVGPIAMPLIEDDSSLKLALANIVASLNSPYAANSLYCDPRRAGLMLYALQIASQVIARSEKNEKTTPAEAVRDVSSDADGNHLAPEKLACEPGLDCPRCLHQDDCSNYEDPDDDLQFEPDQDDEQEEEEDNGAAGSDDLEDEHEEDEPGGEEDEEDGDEDQEDEEPEDDDKPDSDGREDDDSVVTRTALRVLQEDSPPRKRTKSCNNGTALAAPQTVSPTLRAPAPAGNHNHAREDAQEEGSLIDAALRILREESESPKRRASRRTSPGRQGPNPRAA